MRILFFLHNISKTRHFDSVLAALAERGHTVVLAAEQRAHAKPLTLPKSAVVVNRRLAASDLCGRGGRIELLACPVRRTDSWARLAPELRRARDYLRYLDPRYERAEKLRLRAAASSPDGWPQYIDEHPWIKRHRRRVARMLATIEEVIPSATLFEDFISSEKPDLILVTPLVDYGSYQTDYVKGAHRLGIPVGFLPFSWDNLTNRGLIRVRPDRILVWNEIQRKEAVELHHMPEDQVVVTGAPRFDEFFVMRPSTTREDFTRGAGLEPGSPLLLYLCSSPFVAPLEIEFVRRWIDAIRASSDPLVRGSSVLVRPHPANLKPWATTDLRELENVARWSFPQTMNADQGLYDSLFHANAVVGLNTSAMIEAGILGKPVHTVVTGEFAGGQEQTIHFGYLRATNGGLVHEAHSLEEHLQQLGVALGGSGAAGDQERRFVERFVRPRGLDVPLTPIMVEEIERIAHIAKSPRPGVPLWHHPVRWGLRRYFGRLA
jgi:hypothetical protein